MANGILVGRWSVDDSMMALAERGLTVFTGFTAADADLTIDNGGALAEAVEALVQWLRAVAADGAAPRHIET